MAGCASGPSPDAEPPKETPTAAPCDAKGPAGSPALFQNKGGAKIDPPKTCGDESYIRVYGAGTRRFVMGQDGAPRGCTQAPLTSAPETECPELFADAFGRDVTARLESRGIKATGLGLGACGDTKGDYDAWNISISVADWAQADAAVTAVNEELVRWGAGHHFGVTVRAIPCATPL